MQKEAGTKAGWKGEECNLLEDHWMGIFGMQSLKAQQVFPLC